MRFDAIKTFENFANGQPTRRYEQVFEDMLNVLLFVSTNGNHYQNEFERTKADYKQHDKFLEFVDKIAFLSSDFHDALGEIYEFVSSRGKASAMGQFFTPEPICKMMAAMVGSPPNTGTIRMGDMFGCGSGRNILALAAQVGAARWRHFFEGLDLDLMCVKMTVINCWLNAVPCWVIHGNGLTSDTYNAFEVRLTWKQDQDHAGGWSPFVYKMNDLEIKAIQLFRELSFKKPEHWTAANKARIKELEIQCGYDDSFDKKAEAMKQILTHITTEKPKKEGAAILFEEEQPTSQAEEPELLQKGVLSNVEPYQVTPPTEIEKKEVQLPKESTFQIKPNKWNKPPNNQNTLF